MTDEEERQVVTLLRNHQGYGPRTGCICGWNEQDSFDQAEHQARLIRNLLDPHWLRGKGTLVP